ncbi:PEGA domain-containing protein [Candidatus Saccharibacteria bacterium]|nr:PEGA domain-containing protein [Candidatus Saccharibacteria bacterium]
MERAKKKKLYHLRVVATNILMGISVVAIAGILTLLAMGYNLSKDGGLEQSGLLQVRSNPSGATVKINGETQYGRTEMRKMLSEGRHDIVVTKSGYSTWNTTVDIEAGLLTRIDWIRLFPLQRTVENVNSYKTLRLVSASPDNYYLLLLPEDSATMQLIDIHADDIRYSSINLASFMYNDFDFTSSLVPDGQLEIVQWSENHNKFLLKWTTELGNLRWYLVDIANPSSSINLTQKFGYTLNFTDLQIADPAATKIWALESDNLRLINANDTTISAILVQSVEKFSSNTNAVSFIGTSASGNHIVGIYQEGERGSTTIQGIPTDATSYHVTLGKNWADNWLAYTIDNRLFVLAGNYPTYQSNTKLRTVAENDLEFTPSQLTTNPTNRFVVAASEERISTFDVELKSRTEFEFPGTTINWLDNFILWTDQDDKLTIIDFNGENRRSLTTIASGFDLALTSNNRWLYFLIPKPDDKPGFVLQRERL